MHLVLDSNTFQGAPVRALEELHARGHRLSVSFIAWREHARRSLATKEAVRFIRRCQNLRPFVDSELPIIPVGGPLVELAGAKHEAGIPGAIETLRETWTYWSSEAGPFEEDAEDLLRAAVTSQAEFLETWKLLARPHRLIDWVVGRLPSWFVVGAAGEFLAQMQHRRAPGFDQGRWHAYHRCSALLLGEERRKRVEHRRKNENDAEDLALLQHLAMPAIIVSDDEHFIGFIDACGTFQTPWVRTLWEVLEGPLPTGPPWGRGAVEEWERFARPDLKALKARLQPNYARRR